jgi:hypothetical protein
MALTQAHRSRVENTRSVGTAREAEPLTDGDCLYLVGVIAQDLGFLPEFSDLQQQMIPKFFDVDLKQRPNLTGNFWSLFEQLLVKDPNTDTFFIASERCTNQDLSILTFCICNPFLLWTKLVLVVFSNMAGPSRTDRSFRSPGASCAHWL